jgi:cytochrome c oxidase subunit 2
MGLLVIADKQEDYQHWFNAHVAPAPPAAESVKRGEQAFLRSGCVLCHSIRGTTAGGRVGPELTHVGSRRAIAADTLPLTHENLVAWISNPQGVKPGANMPRVKLSDADLDAVARYLESLK